MLSSDVTQIKFTSSLEECLALCLNNAETSKSNACKSVSFNRTDGGCHLSSQNQHSKPTSIRINNNPNYRIDYYENNCYNNSFTFTSNCEPTGIRITVDSLIPYTGALYGLYDFFSCRVEPKEQQHFELFFPYPNYAKNCSDSMRRLENDIFLEVVLSTDGVEPLYFITADDLTYQARCPAPTKQRQISQESYSTTTQLFSNQTTNSPTENLIKNNYIRGNSINAILEELANSATTTIINNSEEEENKKDKKLVESSSSEEEIQKNYEFSPTTSETTKINLKENTKQKNEFTKDTFSLPLYSILQNEFSETTTKINNDTSSTLLQQPFQPTTTTPQQLPSEIEIETTMITFLPRTTSTIPLENNKNGTIKRRRPPTIGMESFFEEEEKLNKTSSTTNLPLQITEQQQQIITSTPQINNKTTTKRSISYENVNNLEAQNREFSFSTHLAFPPDKIFIKFKEEAKTEATPTTISEAKKSELKIPENKSENKSEIKSENKSEATQSKKEINLTTTPITVLIKESSKETLINETTLPPPPSSTSASVASTTSPKLQVSEKSEGNGEGGGLPPKSLFILFISSGDVHPPSTSFGGNKPPGTQIGNIEERRGSQREKVIFEVFHNGQPADAVVVG
uniref:Apple domain-containing protein n=1 Tax=Meloidogyne floridensis TaxID=298350 RepID=A0A915NU44_9BILA